MPEISKTHLGGTMRLGLRPTLFNKDSARWSKIRALYGGAEAVWERHRHRYEINPDYIDRIEKGSPEGPPAHLNADARPSTPPLNKGPRSLPTSPSLNRQDSVFPPNTSAAVKPWTDRLVFLGRSESGERMQIAELVPTAAGDKGHPYFVGMQAHPEFASRPLNPSPPFLGFIAAAAGNGVLEEQIAVQRNFKPPHPPSLMILESERARRQEAEEQAGHLNGAIQKPASTPPGASSPARKPSDVPM